MRWQVWARAAGAAAGALGLFLLFLALGILSAHWLIDMFARLSVSRGT